MFVAVRVCAELAVATAASTPAAASCAPGCISLDFLAGLAGLNSTCICLTNTITNVQHGLQATKQVCVETERDMTARLLCVVA